MSLFLTFPLALSAEVGDADTLDFKVHFYLKESCFDPYFMCNLRNVDNALDSLRSSKRSIISVTVTGYSSPEGNTTRNNILSQERADSVCQFLLDYADDLFSSRSIFNIVAGGESWDSLGKMVAESGKPYAEELSRIIFDTPTWIRENGSVVGGRKKSVMDYNGGSVWFELEKFFFDKLRYAEVSVITVPGEGSDSISVTGNLIPERIPASHLEPVSEIQQANDAPSCQFSIGTNILYDAVGVANLHFQVGFAKRFAFNIMGTFSPWDLTPTHKFRTLIIQPELRFFFKKGFRGPYLGVEGHYGWYNISYPNSSVRYQDADGNTPLWGGGLTFGGIIPFNKHWGMDINISGGYTSLKYDCFYNVYNGDRFNTVSRGVFGPTGARISIYYAF